MLAAASPWLDQDQLRPPFALLKTPPGVATQTVRVFCGSTAMADTEPPSGPCDGPQTSTPA
jgi:hypothetical protein